MLAACGTPTGGPETSGPGAGMGGVTGPTKQTEEDVVWKESETELPPLPQKKDLIEFTLRNPSTGKFFVDGSTLTVGKDRVVRFALVIRSSEGVDNASFAGLKCRGREWKTYAYSADRDWRRVADPQWKPIPNLGYNNYQFTLAQDYMCTDSMFTGGPVGSAKFIVRTLRSPPRLDATVGRKDYSEQR
jgi:hypothetical protein